MIVPLTSTFNKENPRVSELNTLIRELAYKTNSKINEKLFKKFLFCLFYCRFVLSDSDIKLQYPKNKVIPEYDEKIYEQLVKQDNIILPGDTNTTNTILLSLNLIDIHDESNEFYIPTTNGLKVNDIKDELFTSGLAFGRQPIDKYGHRDRNLRIAIDYDFNTILEKKIEEKGNQYNKEVIDKEFILRKLINTGNLDDNDIRYIFLLRNTFNRYGYEKDINKLLNDYVHEGDILNDKKDDLNFLKIMDESNNETLTPLINGNIMHYLKKPQPTLYQQAKNVFGQNTKGGKRRKTSRRTRKPRRKSSRRLRRKSRRQRKR